MRSGTLTFRNGRVFDGTQLHDDWALRYEEGHPVTFGLEKDVGLAGEIVDLGGDIVAPGYVDLQVNGGGGVMLGDDPSVATLRCIAEAHRDLGVAALLPTLITATPEATRAVIDATIDAIRCGVPGIAGLHLEGPHLALARKGAHDAALIRPMTDQDLATLCDAAARLPVLKVTLAPEAVTRAQIATLHRAGVIVAIGHTDADHGTCLDYFAAGATCVTHLFNAMSQLGSRAPGLVGAALGAGSVSAGLIADGVHVHPTTLRAAWAAKTGPGAFYLVSDAMAVAGTRMTGFDLGGRPVRRAGGALTLADGTLAGADLDLTRAMRVMIDEVGVPLDAALAAAITVPSRLIGRPVPGPGPLSDLIRIAADLSAVSRAGAPWR